MKLFSVDRFLSHAKAFLGSVAAAVAVVIFNTTAQPDGSITNWELPNSRDEWVAFVTAVVLGWLLPWFQRNYPSVAKAEADLALAQKRVSTGKQAQ